MSNDGSRHRWMPEDAEDIAPSGQAGCSPAVRIASWLPDEEAGRYEPL
jgi:hypothetical protein